jgi:peptidoglycan/LPS O-acetylase OafA/YrhL
MTSKNIAPREWESGGANENLAGSAAYHGESANLDLLRSAAILYVVAFHLALFFGGQRLDALMWPFGHWGVLMFFVHTSMVLMFSLERQALRYPGGGQFLQFMVRRWFRIAPLSTFIVLAVVLLRLPVGHLHDGHFELVCLSLPGVLWNLLLIQNLTHTDSVVAPLWSLPYEMQMYLVLPALFLFVRSQRSVILLFACWAAAVPVVMAWLRIDSRHLFDMPVYVPCFLAGVLGYRLTRLQRGSWPFFLWPVALAAITLGYVIHPSLMVGWACCLLLAVVVPQCREMPGGLVRNACHLVARYSYGVYLSHFICIWFAFVALADETWIVRIAIFAVSMIAVPVALYHCIELPMIAWGARVARRLEAQILTSNA